MQKIEFGFANEANPKGTWEGIGIKPNTLLTEADFYGTVKLERDSYIIAKVTEDKYNNYPQLVGKFLVRPAIADLYPDGSGIIFLDQEQSLEAYQLEDYLNSPQVKDKIFSIEDIIKLSNGVVPADKAFSMLTDQDRVVTTSITHEVFERKNNALKNCHLSFSELQMRYEQQLETSENITR